MRRQWPHCGLGKDCTEQREKTDRRCYRTHSCLTMDENAMALLKFCFDESDTCDEVGQDVFFFGVVDFDLFVGEGLLGR